MEPIRQVRQWQDIQVVSIESAPDGGVDLEKLRKYAETIQQDLC